MCILNLSHLFGVTETGPAPALSLALTAGVFAEASNSFAAFWNSTLLSPSAVIPACENPIRDPNRLQDKEPWPPHRSLQVLAVRSRFHAQRGLIVQHRMTTSLAVTGSIFTEGSNPEAAAHRSLTTIAHKIQKYFKNGAKNLIN